MVTWRDVSELQSAHRSLRSAHAAAMHAATHDGLTNLPNRPLLLDRMRTGLASLARSRGRMAVVYLDVDNFKHINDRFGHAMGDAVLIAVARRLAMLTREGDTAARISGDEFVLVLTGVDDNWDEEAFHRRLAAAVGEPIDHEGISLTVSLSAGLVMADANDRTPDELLHDADLALYASKGQGKGRLTVFREELREVGIAGRPTPDELHVAHQPRRARARLPAGRRPRHGMRRGPRGPGAVAASRLRPAAAGASSSTSPTAPGSSPTSGSGSCARPSRTWRRRPTASGSSVNLAPSQLLRAPVASEAGSWCQELGVAAATDSCSR